LNEILSHQQDNHVIRERQSKEFLLKLVNMNLFYSHILLRKSDDRKLVT